MAEGWKTIRVFISSTFRDMQAERDHLVRFVFPRLRMQLMKRRIHLVDVDLRWGVTSDQDAFGERVYSDLLSSIEVELGALPPAPPGLFVEESAAMDAFIENRVDRYVAGSRKPVFGALRAYAEGAFEDVMLCVVGPPGSGKSALLGRFCRDHQETAQEKTAGYWEPEARSRPGAQENSREQARSVQPQERCVPHQALEAEIGSVRATETNGNRFLVVGSITG